MIKKLYISLLALAAFGYMAAAQGFDPTVEVSRTYESTLKHTPKPIPSMAVPDSLLRFDLDFDYSVFDRPFQGTGDYKPYLLDLRPQPDAYRGRKLYLKAGLGYTLHPELDFVYSPDAGKDSEVNIYAQHRSYFGKYEFPHFTDNTGYDSFSKVGVNGKTRLSAVQLFYNANYWGLLTKDNRHGYEPDKSSLNALDAMVGIRNAGPSDIFYSAGLNLSFGGDHVSSYEKNLSFFKIGFDGGIGKRLDDAVISTDVHFTRTSYSFDNKAHIGNWYIAPRYITEKDGFRLNLGAKIGSVMHSDVSWAADNVLDVHKSQVIYPDIHVAYELEPGKMDAYADLTGGDDLIGYEEIRSRDHFALPPITDNSLVRFNLNAGLRGNIDAAFRYDVAVGFRSVGHAGLYGVMNIFTTRKVYEDVTEPYLRASFAYDYKPLLIEGRLMFRSMSIGRSSEELEQDYIAFQVYTPRNFSADLSAMYFWKSRIKAGVTARIGSKIKGHIENPAVHQMLFGPNVAFNHSFDGYFDLGLYGEYKVDHMVSVYGRLSNLLNKKYMNDLMMPVSGLYLTAGIIINL